MAQIQRIMGLIMITAELSKLLGNISSLGQLRVTFIDQKRVPFSDKTYNQVFRIWVVLLIKLKQI
jgi:hypothetical protein